MQGTTNYLLVNTLKNTNIKRNTDSYFTLLIDQIAKYFILAISSLPDSLRG